MDMGGRSVPIRIPAEMVATKISVMVKSAAVGAGILRAPHICPSIDGKISKAPKTTASGIVLMRETGSGMMLDAMPLEFQYCNIKAHVLERITPAKMVAVALANGRESCLLRNRDKLKPQQNPAAIAHQSPIFLGTGKEKPPPSNNQTPTSAAAMMAS